MQWLLRIMVCRTTQPPIVRWVEVIVLFGMVLAARMIFGTAHGVVPAISFYPLLLIVTLFFGWLEALVVLCLSVAAAVYLFLPPGMYLQPIGWFIVGGLTIVIITALKEAAVELRAANERQAVLFRELQHRVANTLQSVVGTLEIAVMQMDTSPDRVKTRLATAAQRFSAAAEVHRRLNDPQLFQQGLATVLLDAVGTVVDVEAINVCIEVTPLELSLDQMSVVAMLVIEAANNAQKHVFARNLGQNLFVCLQAITDTQAKLAVKDDGPGWSGAANTTRLGMTIIEGLARQISGKLSVRVEDGTEISVVFPLQA